MKSAHSELFLYGLLCWLIQAAIMHISHIFDANSIPFHSDTNEQEHINYTMLFKMHARARPDYTSLCAGISIKRIYECMYKCYDDAESWWKPNWIFPVWHLIKSKRNSHIKWFQPPHNIIITHKTTKTMLMILSLPMPLPLLFAALALPPLLIVSLWRWTESRQQTEIVKCYTHAHIFAYTWRNRSI